MHKRQNTKICWPFHYGKKSIFSDFQKNHTTNVPVSLFMEFKSAGIFSISCFVSKLEGKLWFSNYFLTVHIKKYLVILLLSLKGSSSGNFESLNVFDTLSPFKKYLKKKKHIFISAHTGTFLAFFRKMF